MKYLRLISWACLLSESYLEPVNSKFIIQSPTTLKELFPEKPGDASSNKDMAGIIKESYANFGLIPYGHSMVSANH